MLDIKEASLIVFPMLQFMTIFYQSGFPIVYWLCSTFCVFSLKYY
uniref:Uncharacterized protein n=1 Tax=Arundo donax TaxID=35708 RepID=A0A0A9B3M8_ARUDO